MSSSNSRGRMVGAAMTLAVLAVAARSAIAQTDELKEQAKEQFADGLELRGRGDDAAALAKFEAAYLIVRSPITALEVGRSLMRLGRLVAARDRLAEAFSMPEKVAESPQAKASRGDAKRLADALSSRIPRLRIKLDGLPPGVVPVVSIDDRQVTSAAPLSVDPGKHHVVARLADGAERREDVEVREGEEREVVLHFGAQEALARPADHGGPSAFTYAAFGVAGLGLTLGAVTGLAARSKASDLRTSPWCSDSRCLPPAHDAIDSYNRTAALSTVSFVVAGIAGGVGIYSLLAGHSNGERPIVAHVEPWIGPGSMGVGGAF